MVEKSCAARLCDSLNEGSLRLVGDSNPGLQIQSLLC